jgi:hypothetical protein
MASLLTVLKEELEQHEQLLDLRTLASLCSQQQVRGHLAVLTKPYLEKIITGQKTIESRFSKSRTPPFDRVQKDDIVFLKEVSGPIHAIALTSQVLFFGPLKPGEAEYIMESYQEGLQLDSDFQKSKQDSHYATLISLGRILPIKPIQLIKLDRRPWVILKDVVYDKIYKISKIPSFAVKQDCEAGLHTYHNSKILNSKGNPMCRYCGIDTVDWERMHRRDLQDIDYTISQLQTEKFRYEWWMKEFDQRAKNHALRKGLLNLRLAASARLLKSVGVVYEMPDGTKRPYRDGLQTPYSGNSIYYAQHALACCCRKCMCYWHGVPYGRNLSEEELLYFTELVMSYIGMKLPEIQMQGLSIPRIGLTSNL